MSLIIGIFHFCHNFPRFLKRSSIGPNRLMNFLNSNNLRYLRQYGFRKNMSTSMAIMELVENITNAMDNGKFTVGVFIDLIKAFDTVDHRILVTELDITELGVLPKNG